VTLARAQTASRVALAAPAVEHALEGTRRAQRSEHAGPNSESSQTGEHHYNLSRERIRQLQEQAIGKIRKQMREF
jgi:DNA-directed RNA polymerase sigma subunit (sigma70/sigma32)